MASPCKSFAASTASSASLRRGRRRFAWANTSKEVLSLHLFSIGSHRIIVFGSMNYIEADLNGLRPEAARSPRSRNNSSPSTERVPRSSPSCRAGLRTAVPGMKYFGRPEFDNQRTMVSDGVGGHVHQRGEC
jgi:hypothetical protein